jgi:tripartite-type tricarboxylate transporter receptor subunit TctC
MRLFAALSLLLAAIAVQAQTYPNRAVRIVVPFPPGSAPDQVARLAGAALQASLAQPFVVENKVGAQGSIGSTEVARANADGYTLLLANNTTHAANPSLFRKLPYDPITDFAPIARVSTTALLLLVRPDFPAQSVRELIALARAKPEGYAAAYGSAGSQVAIAQLRQLGDARFLEVPYKGVPPAVADLLSGQVALTFADYAVGFAQTRAGKLKALGVSAATRTPLAPALPAIAEELPGFEITTWFGLVAPAATPPAAIERLYESLAPALAAPELRGRFTAIDLDVAPLAPAAFGAFMRAEVAKWARQIRAAGIQPE